MVTSMLPSSPFQAGPSMNGATPQASLNPMQLLDAMQQLAPRQTEFAPRYPPGYKKPKRPTEGEVKQRADRLFDEHALWRSLIEVTVAWLRHERVGMFPEDEEDRRNGLQEQWIDNALTAKRNIVISKVAASKMGIRKRYHNDDLRRKAQMIEDSAAWLNEEFALQWVQKGNRVLKIDEATQLTDRGMFVSRQVFDVSDPDMPLNVDLIEPTQVYPVWGGKRGLQEVYRIYRDTIGSLTSSYGDMTPEVRAKLKKKSGNDLTDQTEVNVYEYWNTWDRCVLIDDQPLIPFTEHEYGYVPWTIQYGGFGDSMNARTPGNASRRGWNNTNIDQIDRTTINERAYKAVPLIYYDTPMHEMLEAIMGRLVTGFKREINPPIIRERSTMIAGTEVPEFSQAPGAVNEVRLGEEKVSVTPSLANNPITGMIVQSLDSQRNRTDPTINYNADKSNVTGAALSRMGDEGTEHILPIYQSLEMAKTHQFTQIFQTIANWGHLTKYGGGTPKPLLVPVRKATRQGESPAFELSREIIDEVGPRVEITFNKINPADWMGLFNAGKIGIELGAMSPDILYEMAMGDTDYDSFFEKWAEQKAVMNALAHPKFNEMFLIPQQIAEQIKESAGDPEMVKYWSEWLQGWLQMAQQPQEMGQPQPGAGGPPMPGQQPGGPPPPPPGSQMVAPPSGAGQTLPAAMGPGSQGAPVGRPY